MMQEKPVEIKKSNLSVVSEASVSNWLIEKKSTVQIVAEILKARSRYFKCITMNSHVFCFFLQQLPTNLLCQQSTVE